MQCNLVRIWYSNPLGIYIRYYDQHSECTANTHPWEFSPHLLKKYWHAYSHICMYDMFLPLAILVTLLYRTSFGMPCPALPRPIPLGIICNGLILTPAYHIPRLFPVTATVTVTSESASGHPLLHTDTYIQTYMTTYLHVLPTSTKI